jgi:hypothetical protein
MEEKISCCGINCLECEAYKATLANDDKMREEVAVKWSQAYNPDIKAKDINCTGCNSDGQVFEFCRSCNVRQCSLSKGHPNCAHCQDYPCQTYSKHCEFIPGIKDKLDSIKSSL